MEVNGSPTSNTFSTQINVNKEENNFFEDNRPAALNIAIPLVEALQPSMEGRNQTLKGLSVKAAFQREEDQMFLQLIFENSSSSSFKVKNRLFRILP